MVSDQLWDFVVLVGGSSLLTRRFDTVYEFFPPELHPIIGKDKDTGKVKQLMFSSLGALNPLDDLPDFDDAEDDENKDGEKKPGADEDGAGDAGSDEEPDDFDDDDDVSYIFWSTGTWLIPLRTITTRRTTSMMAPQMWRTMVMMTVAVVTTMIKRLHISCCEY